MQFSSARPALVALALAMLAGCAAVADAPFAGTLFERYRVERG